MLISTSLGCRHESVRYGKMIEKNSIQSANAFDALFT
jgi:hypothetical protein